MTEMTNKEYKEYMLKSIGGSRVCLSFNPSQDFQIDKIKTKTADLINILAKNDILKAKAFTDFEKGEVARIYSIAKTKYEEACMWAVKAFVKHSMLIKQKQSK